jgi:heme A synthase
VVVRTARIGLGLVVVQLALGAAMVTGHYVTAVRSLHQATGISLWLTAFVLTLLARRSAGLSPAPQAPGGAPSTGGFVPAAARPLGGAA